MAVLVDTCILVPAFNPVAGEHRLVRQALLRLTDQGERLVTTPQNLAELWNVCTRPAASNGRGLDPRQVQKMIRILRRMTDLRCESAEALERWAEIVVRHAVRGVSVHDARLVGVMLAEKIPKILTFNVQDFQRYGPEGIEVLTPGAVCAGSG